MPDAALYRVLAESVEEVLETMFFICALEEPQLPAVAEDGVSARLSFEGDPAGWLALEVTSAAARSVAAAFLGEEEADLTEAQTGEVICELANMICGSVLSRVENGCTFSLAAPQIVPPAEAAAPQPAAEDVTVYAAEIEHGMLTVRFQTETPVCLVAKERAS